MARPKRWGRYDYIPALAGMPHDQQKHLYNQARLESWQYAVLVVVYILCIVVVWYLKDTIYGGWWNPGLSRPVIYGFLVAMVIGLWLPIWRWHDLHVLAPRIWRRLPHICNGCGYDLTGNVSGKCPECGLDQDVVP